MKYLLVFIAVLIGFSSQAQHLSGKGGAFVIGSQWMSSDELQAFTPNAPLPSTSNLSMGGYFYWQLKNNMVVGFKGSGFHGSEESDANISYKRKGGQFAADIGYKVINKEKLGIYPLLGIGFGGMSYRVSENGDIDLGSGEPLTPYEAEYNVGNFVLDVGIRVERLFGIKTNDCGSGGGMFGIEAGYQFAPGSSDWETSTGAQVLNAPSFSMEGAYVRLLIGGFSNTSKVK